MDYLRVHYDEATIEHVGSPSFITALQSSRYVYESWYAVNDRTPAYQSAIFFTLPTELLTSITTGLMSGSKRH